MRLTIRKLSRMGKFVDFLVSRLQLLDEWVKKEQHLGWEMIVVFNLTIPLGIVGYWFLINHDQFYGNPYYFILLGAFCGTYAFYIRKMAKFIVNKILFADEGDKYGRR